MKSDNVRKYAIKSERMVRPEDLAVISIASGVFSKLPKGVQNKMMKDSSKKNKYMGFVVEPYSFFLTYEITDVEAAQKLIPKHYKIVPTTCFADGKPRPAVIFGFFNVHTSAFWGSRVEMYIIAEHEETGMLSWLIVDYDSDTNSYDPGQGFIGSTSDDAVITTTYQGEVVVDIPSNDGKRGIALSADIKNGKMRPLDQRLWLEGNLSVDYGDDLGVGESEPFGLVFSPDEMEQALLIDPKDVKIEKNDWYSDIYADEPFQIACFPYAQHFVTTTFPRSTGVRHKDDLINSFNEINASEEKMGFSLKEMKKAFAIGSAISMLTTLGLGIWILLLYLL